MRSYLFHNGNQYDGSELIIDIIDNN